MTFDKDMNKMQGDHFDDEELPITSTTYEPETPPPHLFELKTLDKPLEYWSEEEIRGYDEYAAVLLENMEQMTFMRFPAPAIEVRPDCDPFEPAEEWTISRDISDPFIAEICAIAESESETPECENAQVTTINRVRKILGVKCSSYREEDPHFWRSGEHFYALA